MNINEIKNLEKNNYTNVEVYKETNKGYSRAWHGDFLKEIERYTGLEEVERWTVMDKDDYNNSILANSCMFFEDFYEKNEKILVILLKK